MIFESLADKEGGREQYAKRGLLCRGPFCISRAGQKFRLECYHQFRFQRKYVIGAATRAPSTIVTSFDLITFL